MAEEQPLYATGSSVLFEGDVDRQWLDEAGAGGVPGLWSPGPVVFTRRSTMSDRQRIDLDARQRRLGHGIARHTVHADRRLHRRVSYTVRTVSSTGSVREMRIVALELILGGRSATRVGVDEQDRWIPAIVVVHLDLPGDQSTTADATSDLRFEHVGNLVAPFIRWNIEDCCGLLERFLTAEGSSGVVVKEDGTFRLSEQGVRTGNPETDAPRIRLLASPRHESTAALPLYWILADVAPEKQADDERWNADMAFYETGPGQSIGLADCSPVERRARRSRVLAELSVRPWATESVGTPSAIESSDPLAWRNWHVSFSRSGAGFAHSSEHSAGVTNAHRRDDLSTVYVDLIALEMLKDRVIQRFAEVTRDLASEPNQDRAFRERCMETWKALVLFASQYFVRSAGISVRDRDVMHGFHAGVGIDLDHELARVQDNLERLAEIARIEIEEERNALETTRNQRERDFNRIVGLLATVFIPLTAVPPIVEWFVPLPSIWALVLGLPVILVVGALVALPMWRHVHTLESPRVMDSSRPEGDAEGAP